MGSLRDKGGEGPVELSWVRLPAKFDVTTEELTPCFLSFGGYKIGSAAVNDWSGHRYPEFIAEGSGDQKAIMGAICKIKDATFDGVNCVGGDPDATGEVSS